MKKPFTNWLDPKPQIVHLRIPNLDLQIAADHFMRGYCPYGKAPSESKKQKGS
jgi:hypothetical protein